MSNLNLSDKTDIAIIGMSGRFPGARNVEEFWTNLRDGVESICPLSEEELTKAGVDSSLISRPDYVKAGGPLIDVEYFDAQFFGFSPKDAAIMDPQHRHFMECCWEALEHAAHPPSKFPGSVGVFAGCGMNAYFMRNVLPNSDLMNSVGLFLLRHTGNDRDFLPTTVSYKFNLHGPSVAIQTACSTSLVAIHMACQSLLNGECDMALAGGVTIQVPHGQGYIYRPNEIHSPDGHCRAFDASSAGTVITNGAGVVVLRRLSDAVQDNDFIHAVIKSSAINNDGANKVGYLAPSVDGHAEVVDEALALADLTADDISYVETHGTGTAVGDPIEIAALTEAFRRSTDRVGFCPIGSVKTNIGHLDTAAGVASVIKVAEALKHRKIPPSLNYEAPNPSIDFENSPFFVNAQLREWKSETGPRRAGISSLGVGGTNAHVILEESPIKHRQHQSPNDSQWQILTLSAKTPTALDAATQNLAQALANQRNLTLENVAFTLQEGREAFEHRRILVTRDIDDAVAKLQNGDPKRVFSAQRSRSTPSIIFLFPGGGTQYPNMGHELYETEPVYRQILDRCFQLLKPLVDFDLRSLMFPSANAATAAKRLRDVCPSICAIFITEYATAKLLMSWGIKPEAFTGHSLGEYTAACITGVISLADALKIVALRGQLVEQLSDAAMLTVPLPKADLREILGSELDLAAVNGPSFCLVSGLSPALDQLEETLAQRDLECRRLHINGASHCRWLDPILPEFRAAISQIKLNPPQMPYISNVTGNWVRAEDATNPDYWVKHFRDTVLFSNGLNQLLTQNSECILLEVGPGNTLGSLARQQPTKPLDILASLPRHDDSTPARQFLLSTLGRLWTRGVSIDWSHLRDDQLHYRVPLPTYTFERQYYWIDPPQTLNQTTENTLETLQKSENWQDWFYHPVWHTSEIGETPQLKEPQKWLLFVDSLGFGSEIEKRLKFQGHEVVTVRAGDVFYRENEQEFILPPELGREAYDLLIETLAEESRLPDHVLHLWLVSADDAFRPGSNLFHTNQERGFYSLLFLAQALGSQDALQLAEWIIISNDMQSLEGRSLFPDKSTVLGPVLVIPHELKGITCRSVDISLKPLQSAKSKRARLAAREQIESCLLTELNIADPSHAWVAWREGQRWHLDFEKLNTWQDHNNSKRLRKGGRYLITGGLSGIGLQAASHLAKHYQARLVLLSRRQLPQREEWYTYIAEHTERDPIRQTIHKILSMEEYGAEVMVQSADVTNIQQMNTVLSKIEHYFGSLQGVIHAAGLTNDAALQTKSQESINRVFAPKVQGTLVLSKLLENQPLDFMVMFSSNSSILGPAGQVDYVAANSFLDAFAQSNQVAKNCYTVAVNWSAWKDIGQAQRIQNRLLHNADPAIKMSRRTKHPLLDEWVDDSVDSMEFLTDLRVQDHWILDDHRLKGGKAIVPGSGYLEIAAGAAREALGIEQLTLQNVSFIAPLYVLDTETKRMRVTLNRQDRVYSFEVSSDEGGDSGWILNAQGTIRVESLERKQALNLEQIRQQCDQQRMQRNGRPLTTSQSQQLEFGPRWNCLQEIHLAEQEALAKLKLTDDFVADLENYPLHPALMDIATGFGLPLIKGYSADESLYVPVSYQSVRVYAPLSQIVYSYLRSDPSNSTERQLAIFDIVITDAEGQPLVEVDRFSVKRTDNPTQLSSKFQLPSLAAHQTHLSDGEQLFLETYRAGIEPAEGMQVLEHIINYGQESRIVVSTTPLNTLIQNTHAVAQQKKHELGVKFARPELQSNYEAPQDNLERTLAGFWEELLGVDQVGVLDDFFSLGGHSLIAVRLFARIQKHYKVEYPISTLFDAPTIRQFSQILWGDIGEETSSSTSSKSGTSQRWKYLVPLHTSLNSPHPPFFLVAGMFGNVLNLRHLAIHLGTDCTIYAVQARGLYGDDRPHNRFPDMARDYLREIRQVQPEGPYYLGGFSGGGITAYEMAQQLTRADQKVGAIVMLDTFPPDIATQYLEGSHLSMTDRLRIHWQRFNQSGLLYFKNWAQSRLAWELRRFKPSDNSLQTSAEFRSEEIRLAFEEALWNYVIESYPGKVILFRPPLDCAYKLSGGRIATKARELVDHYNHWSPHVKGGIEVYEVIGDHDSMVLEPYVRVLATKLRGCLLEAQKEEAKGGSIC